MDIHDIAREIPQWVINASVDGLQELALRLEIDSASLVRLCTSSAQERAKELQQKADTCWKAVDFFLSL